MTNCFPVRRCTFPTEWMMDERLDRTGASWEFPANKWGRGGIVLSGRKALPLCHLLMNGEAAALIRLGSAPLISSCVCGGRTATAALFEVIREHLQKLRTWTGTVGNSMQHWSTRLKHTVERWGVSMCAYCRPLHIFTCFFTQLEDKLKWIFSLWPINHVLWTH